MASCDLNKQKHFSFKLNKLHNQKRFEITENSIKFLRMLYGFLKSRRRADFNELVDNGTVFDWMLTAGRTWAFPVVVNIAFHDNTARPAELVHVLGDMEVFLDGFFLLSHVAFSFTFVWSKWTEAFEFLWIHFGDPWFRFLFTHIFFWLPLAFKQPITVSL